MMSHVDIEAAIASGELGITNLAPGAIQPASVDLRLGEEMLIKQSMGPRPYLFDSTTYPRWTIIPEYLFLGSTIERIRIPNTIAAKFEGKSSLGRRGIMTHITAGFVDPGFEGELTLEITAIGGPEILRPGDKIGQLCFYRLDTAAEVGYGDERWGSHYQGQTGPTGVLA